MCRQTACTPCTQTQSSENQIKQRVSDFTPRLRECCKYTAVPEADQGVSPITSGVLVLDVEQQRARQEDRAHRHLGTREGGRE